MWRCLLFGFSLCVNLILAYKLIWGEQGFVAYKALREQQRSIETRIRELDEANRSLSTEIRLLQSDEKYQEKAIRKRLNFVKDNEILYIFPGAHDAAQTGAGPDEAKN